MILLRFVAVAAFMLVTTFAQAQECATGPAPLCGGTCAAGFVCTLGQSGTPCECVAGTVLAVTKLSIKLNFAKALADNVVLGALVPVPAGFGVSGRLVIVDVGGIVRTFVLDDKGKAKSDGAEVKLGVKTKKGVVAAQTAKLTFKAPKGNFDPKLADEGIVDADVDQPDMGLRVEVHVDAQLYARVVTLSYKATHGKTGKAYLSK